MLTSFFGRDRELARLHDSFEIARSGSPRVVLIEGAAGMGKSALLDRFLDGVDDARILRASGDEDEVAFTFGLADQLRGDVRGAHLADRSRIGRDPVGVGAELLQRFEPEEDEAVVVAVDDVHWADVPSLNALTFALRRLRDDAVLTILTARPERASVLPGGLERIIAGRAGDNVVLEGLTASDLRLLASAIDEQPLSSAAAETLREHTDGSPLHAAALVRELGASQLNAADGQPLPAPRRFATLVLAQLAACAHDTIRFVQAAAVLGPASIDTTAALPGVSDGIAAFDEAARAELLVLRDGCAAFTHPLVRAAVYHDLGPVARAALHDRAWSMTDEPDIKLRHRVASVVGTDAAIADEARNHAMAATARRDWTRAAAAFEDAARVAPTPGERERFELEAAECLLLAGDVRAVASRIDRIETMHDSAMQRYVSGFFHLLVGAIGEAERRLRSAWDRDPPPDVGRRISDQLAVLYAYESRADDAVAWSRRAIETGGESWGVAHAEDTLLTCLALGGHLEEARALSVEVRSDVDVPGFAGAAVVALWSDEHARARSDLQALVFAARENGRRLTEIAAMQFLMQIEYRLGHWDDAVAHAQVATSSAVDGDVIWLASLINASAVPVHAARAEWDVAETYVAAATAYATSEPQQRFADFAGAILASARGDHEQVVRSLSSFAGTPDPSVEEPGIIAWRDLLTESLVALGRIDDAEEALVPLERRASERGLRSALSAAARARGSLESARGKADAADEAFRRGLEQLDGLPWPFDRARLDLAYGSHLRRRGRRADAASFLRSAQATLERLGAHAFLDRCDRELAACGFSPSRRDPERFVRLTPQEQAVVHLVRRGMSNREVASELVVSIRTVEYHLTNAYAKLGVRSRSQLMALASIT